MEKTEALSVEPVPWRRLVSPGHVWVARLNTLTWLGGGLLVIVLLLGWLDYRAATKLAEARVAAIANGDHWLVRFLDNSWLTPDTPQPQAAPLDLMKTKPLPATALSVDELAGRSDIVKFIADEVAALDAAGNLDPQYPLFDLQDIRQPWVTPEGKADSPLVRRSADGHTIWLAAIGTDGTAPRTIFGAFRKRDGRWSWFDVAHVPEQMLITRNVVSSTEVVNAIRRDFAELN